jgi:hypothetical protein
MSSQMHIVGKAPMVCSDCGEDAIRAKDGLCRSCRVRIWGKKATKYPWTPEMDALLTRAYRGAKSKTDLTKAKDDLVRRFRMPRHILQNRACLLGLRTREQRPWTDAEIAYVREHSGEFSLGKLAKMLGRSEYAVKNKLFTLGLGVKVTEGFAQRELADLFGVHHGKVNRWIGRGWLQLRGERVTYESVQAFVWDHMDEYRFASCEEWWLKTMLKPTLGQKRVQNEDRRSA